MASGKLTEAELIRQDKLPHARRPMEQDAVYWESLQAAKYGWDAEQYEDYYKRLTDERTRREQQASPMRTPRRGGSTTRPLDNPESERVWAVVPALSRRPVEVRKHLRRLKFK